MHLEFLLEEPSVEAFLDGFLPRVLPAGATWKLIQFQGKGDLLANLERRLKGYRNWLPAGDRIVVLIDEDRQDCRKLKDQLEVAAQTAGFVTKSAAGKAQFQVVNRVAIEELEAWFLGDIEAIRAAYPRVPASLANRENFRDPDAVAGGTWEALERELKRAGYFPGGLAKIEFARVMAQHLEPTRNRSRSFQVFLEGLQGPAE